MAAPALRAARLFVSASLVLGGFLLLIEARLVQDVPSGWAWIAVAAFVWSATLVVVLVLAAREPWPWTVPAAVLIGSMIAGVGWSHFDPAGHYVLGLLAPVVAVLTGVGLYRREPWAWPVALAIVAGIGPLFLAIVPLPAGAYLGALALFLVDALALLALAPEVFEKTPM